MTRFYSAMSFPIFSPFLLKIFSQEPLVFLSSIFLPGPPCHHHQPVHNLGGGALSLITPFYLPLPHEGNSFADKSICPRGDSGFSFIFVGVSLLFYFHISNCTILFYKLKKVKASICTQLTLIFPEISDRNVLCTHANSVTYTGRIAPSCARHSPFSNLYRSFQISAPRSRATFVISSALLLKGPFSKDWKKD